MSLERKDLRVYLDQDVHAGLAILADEERVELHSLAEEVIRDYVFRKVHAAIVIAEKAERAGLVRIKAVSSGSTRKGP